MYSFKNDYSEGVHPNILRTLIETNLIQQAGYGEDEFTNEAIHILKNKINKEDIDIHLLVGGTQTNLIAISAFLRPYEAVISANTGHIFVNETGAIEATGHKVIAVNVNDGKLRVEDIKPVIEAHSSEHAVKPKLVYISNPTEIGTIYQKNELEELSQFCRENDLLFYMDGARLGSALVAKENDLTLLDFATLLDSFYIGGTKHGALFGEALIISSNLLKSNFRFNIKQKGGLLAKGRALGIQFSELFKNDLYLEVSTHANIMAEILHNGIKDLGFNFLINSPTNQLFPILPNKIIEKLEQDYSFYRWTKIDENNSAIRLVTSWATLETEVTKFIKVLKELKN
ncbi:low specificity L-threonine aldolase [Cetobacterium sp. ZWU0022]|uniref:threonine aldolase family protein n=1 Tax=Cetobacterium sp. ZWU0022 TaxID=1340502 RepID=UPI0006460D87|nr:aminotransferase class I/II-fold pyridoxal phosphate-dependent enzyme [Cetobacterium sp. ZWU0022]